MKLYLNNKLYKGEAVYINGFNGYESTDNDGILCALINDSLWIDSIPNILKDKDGNSIRNKSRRGQYKLL